ncbi:MAG: SelB C-terminal domain-containing protein, partial [Actinomycetota bacterium]|nr:SelB C-terminal domain-containing protein [Actinomycetota bacterium]
GTVVTGTLESGHITVGDELELHRVAGADGIHGLRGTGVRVRGLQCLGRSAQRVDAVARVAVNVRGVELHQVRRGDALATPGTWRPTDALDARLTTIAADLPTHLVLHIGTAAVPARVRPLDGKLARLTTTAPLPMQTGDRAILRDPARQTIAAGVLVLDVDPPPLRRRGSAAQRATTLRSANGAPNLGSEMARRGSARRADLVSLGVLDAESGAAPAGVKDVDGWLVSQLQWQTWQTSLLAAVDRHATLTPLDPRMTLEAARRTVGLPDPRLLPRLAGEAGLEVLGGRVSRPGVRPDLGAAETGVRELEQRLSEEPFRAPEHAELVALGLGQRELAAAAAAGRLLRLSPEVVLLPGAPALAMRALTDLEQPFSVSQARQAWGTTRRVALPLLEHLDARAWTERIGASLRRVARSGSAPQGRPPFG